MSRGEAINGRSLKHGRPYINSRSLSEPRQRCEHCRWRASTVQCRPFQLKMFRGEAINGRSLKPGKPYINWISSSSAAEWRCIDKKLTRCYVQYHRDISTSMCSQYRATAASAPISFQLLGPAHGVFLTCGIPNGASAPLVPVVRAAVNLCNRRLILKYHDSVSKGVCFLHTVFIYVLPFVLWLLLQHDCHGTIVRYIQTKIFRRPWCLL